MSEGRLARHREEMRLALRENLSLDEARRRLSALRWQQTLDRIDARRAVPATAGPKPTPPSSWMKNYENY